MSEAGAPDRGETPAEVLTAAQPGSPGSGDPGRGAVRHGSVRIVVAAVLTVLFLAAAWFAARRGVTADTWPAFLPGTDSTSITRYSGPWLTTAAAAVLGAGLSIMALVRGLRARSAR